MQKFCNELEGVSNKEAFNIGYQWGVSGDSGELSGSDQLKEVELSKTEYIQFWKLKL